MPAHSSRPLMLEREWFREFGAMVSYRRAVVWAGDYASRHSGLPGRMLRPIITNGIGYTPFPDEDGVGGWGRHVRQWEDREDER